MIPQTVGTFLYYRRDFPQSLRATLVNRRVFAGVQISPAKLHTAGSGQVRRLPAQTDRFIFTRLAP
jgi:hypothetical protein